MRDVALPSGVMRPAGDRSLVAPSGLKLQRKCSCGMHASNGGQCRECASKRLQRKPERGAAATAPPSSVHEVLRSSGHALDPAARQFFERGFGHDFGRVRIHADGRAADSARSVGALAYTVGADVVFGTAQYAPESPAGRKLLAHELVHVMQQRRPADASPAGGLQIGSPDDAQEHEADRLADDLITGQARPSVSPAATGPKLQRACRSAAQCAVPSQGNAAQFGATVEAESEANAVASGGVSVGGHTSCLLPRHGQRATSFEALATTAGLGATIAPGIDGYFINACLSAHDGANNAPCSEFPGGPPAHTQPDHACVQIHPSDEDMAATLLARHRPLGDADLRQFLSITATVAHESQHHRFDANPGAIVPPAADCNVNTPVPVSNNAPVESLLSEISAEIGEFDVYFRNSTANPSRSSTFAMQSEEHDIATRGGENILGNIRDLQCACACSTVERFVENVFAQASASWTAAEKVEFERAMTGFMPSFWPRALQHR